MKMRRLHILIFFAAILVIFNCKKEPGNPEKPTNLILTVISQTEIDLSWTDNSTNETGFIIDRSLSESSGWTKITSVSSNTESYNNNGLTASTKYFYRIYAFNASGNSEFSNLANASTLDIVYSLPEITTSDTSSVTHNSAISGGNITSDGNASVTDRGVCWSTSENPDTTNNKTSDGTGTGSFTSSLTGLTPNTLYYIRAFATNSVGTSYGQQVSFTTADPPIEVPILTTTAVSSITTSTASTGGNITDDGGSEVLSRGVCWSTSENPDTTNYKTSDGAGTGSFTSNLTGLTASTHYYLRAYAINSVGIAYGGQVDFTTSAIQVPILTTTAGFSITSTSAKSGGNITDEGTSAVTARGICYSTSANPTIANDTTLNGSGTGSYISNMTELTPNTKYYIRAYATNSHGTGYGNEVTITTAALPTTPPGATTSEATTVTATSATLNGYVNANASNTTVTFEYGTTILYGSSKTATPGVVSGITPTSVLADITDLIPNTKYHFRVKAVSAAGTVYGDDMTFTTLQAPIVTTQAATSLNNTTATLNGLVNANGLATTITFEYGTTTSYGTVISGVPDNIDGTVSTAIKADITGLTQNTTYHFRIKAVSSAGTTIGSDLSFTTTSVLIVVPTVSTSVVTDITQTTATGGGNITSDGGAALTSSGVCWSTETDPTINDSKTSDGTTTGDFTSSITGLTAGTTYYIKAYATNSAGTGYGAERSFSTNTVVVTPTVTTTSVSDITTTTAVSGGEITSDGGAEVTVSGICWSTLPDPTIADSKTTDGSANGSFTSSITGLTAATKYYVRAYATNSAGTSYGNEKNFTTNSETFTPPTATSFAASDITNISATLNGQVNANESSTTVIFEYGTSDLYGSTISSIPGTVTGDILTSVNAVINELNPGQTYHFRVKAMNAGGTVYGDDLVFTTQQPPTATTLAATNMTQTTATLNGLVNANELSTDISFEYGPTTDYGTSITGVPGSATGTVNTSSSVDISELTQNTTYHFRIVAVSSAGTTYGDDMSFTTTSEVLVIPTLSTSDITAITETTASGGGNITSDGGALVTDRGVCWSTSADPTTTDPKTSDGTGTGSFTSDITELTAGTTYYVRAYAINSVGTAYGNNVTFTTSVIVSPSVTTLEASDISQTTATLNGTVNANDLTATVTFEYGLTEAYGETITADQSPVTGSSNTAVSADISDLSKDTQYNFRVKVVSSTGTNYGLNQVFNTLPGVLPTVTTTAITGITSSGATSGGNVTSEGSDAVTEKGVCWNTTANPTIVNSRTSDGTGSGSYSSTITELDPGTTYHVRAYATNSEGTAYGSDLPFTTGIVVVIPTITTTAISDIGTITATGGGNITNDGGASVTARGVCWSTSANPETTDAKTTDGNGTGTFSSSITGLDPGTTYHVRAYATNSAGDAYGDDISFTTNNIPVVPSLTTTSVTSITPTTAVSGGNVTFDGDATVTDRGVCWSTSPGPTISDTKTSDGNGTGSFISNITGLTGNTTYYVRAYAINSVGPGYGNEIPFTTACIAPTSVTNAASSIAATSATLNGTVDANAFSTTVTFEYGLTTGYGSSVTATQSPVTGSTGTAVNKGISGLSPNTVYHFRVKSVNCGGTVYGNDLTFTTLCTPPAATTVAASPVGTTSATLKGSVNANGTSTTVTFEFGLTTAYGSTIAATPGTVAGTDVTSVTASLSGLTPNTLYHYRVKAVNCGGTVYGSDLTLTTSCVLPSATTLAASSITSSTSTLNGNVNPNYASTTVTFQYGTTTSYGSIATATQSPVTGSSETAVSKGITGLAANTLYHYRVKAVSCGGTNYGSDMTFTTSCAAPAATSVAASGITSTTANINGTIAANYASTTVTFQYGLTTGYGSTVSATPGTVTGNTSTPVSAAISSLTPNTTYNFRVKAVNCGGTTYGSNLTFTTACIAPTASTGSATDIGTSTATFNGTVNPKYASTTVTFDYGTTTSYGSSVTATQSPLTGSVNTAVSKSMTGLAQNTTYHYRVKAVSCGGTVYGTDKSFTTSCVAPSATTVEAQASGPSEGVALLKGLVDANGNSTTVYFDYGTSTAYGSTVYGSPSTVSSTSNVAVSKAVSGFTEGTTYYFRVRATSCGGTAYGASSRFTLDKDGNAYHMITPSKAVGTWMVENLRATFYSDATPVPPGCDTCTVYMISYQAYNNNSTYTNTYGLLYNGYTVDSPKNICPTGWHVPTDAEWTTLVTYVGGATAAGGHLKETGYSYWNSPNTGADNSIGFKARGGGYYTTTFYDLMNRSRWWSDNSLNYIQMYNNSASVYQGTGTLDYYNYIRCKK